MTHRTEHAQPTPVEIATREVLQSIPNIARSYFIEHQIAARQRIPEKEFLRILALYFEQKTLADWCHDFGIPDASDPSDKPSHGGEA